MAWLDLVVAHLWQNVWAVLPLALLAGLVSWAGRCSPVTRHGLWVIVLAWFLLAPLLPAAPSADWLRRIEADAVAAASDSQVPAESHAGLPGSPAAPPAGTISTASASSPPQNTASDSPPRSAIHDQRYGPSTRVAARDAEPLAAMRRDLPPLTPSKPRPVYAAPTAPSDSSSRETRPQDGAAVPLFDRTLETPALTLPRASADVPTLDRAARDGRAGVAPRAAQPGGTQPSAPSTRTAPARRSVSSAATAASEPRATPTAPRPAPETAHETRAAAPDAKTPPQTPRDSDEKSGTPLKSGSWQAAERWMLACVAGLVRIRAAIAGMPSVPVGVWIAGAALVLCWNLIGVLMFLWRLRGGRAAPPWVLREARRVARRLGLQQLPRIRMVPARISPLVWCGWRPLLVLPIGLWQELDSAGRCAILCHELAHLRRRDHWILRLDFLVGLLFWWHPVAWWARRRAHEEADNCCDAWVTWLMPRDRRAYAEALLRTRVFIQGTPRATPTLGAAVTTPGARRLARRLTMVMTQNVRPRPSFSGFAIASGLIVSGWLLAPAVSVAQDAAPAIAPAAPASPTPLFGGGGNDEKADKVDKAENDAASAEKEAARAAKAAAKAEKAAAEGAAKAAAKAGKAAAEATRRAEVAAVAAQSSDAVAAGPMQVRAHKVSPGKKELLAALLLRDDVPLRVRELPDGIEVHAGAEQQAAFAAFVQAIEAASSAKQWREYPLAGEKLAALYALMARDDVPIMVSQSDGTLRAEVTEAQHEMMQRFMRLLGGPAAAPVRSRGPGSASVAQPYVYHLATPRNAQSGSVSVVAPSGAAAMRQQQSLLMNTAKAYRQQITALEKQQAALQKTREQSVEELRQRAAQLAEKAAALQAEIERVREAYERVRAESSGSGNSNEQRDAERKARELQRKIREMERAAERTQRQAEQTEEKADATDAEDPYEERIVALNSLLEGVEAELDAVDDAVDVDADAGDAEAPAEQAHEAVAETVKAAGGVLAKALRAGTPSNLTTAALAPLLSVAAAPAQLQRSDVALAVPLASVSAALAPLADLNIAPALSGLQLNPQLSNQLSAEIERRVREALRDAETALRAAAGDASGGTDAECSAKLSAAIRAAVEAALAQGTYVLDTSHCTTPRSDVPCCADPLRAALTQRGKAARVIAPAPSDCSKSKTEPASPALP